MNYESLIYELIKFLIKWGLWKPDAAFYYNGKKYLAVYDETEATNFYDLHSVKVIECNITEAICYSEPPKQYELFMTNNIRISDLFTYGFYGISLDEVPFETKTYLLRNNEELMDDFYDSIDYIDDFPELYPDLPNINDFNSHEEYIKARTNYIETEKEKYINNLDVEITVNNYPEAEIGIIIMKYGLSYSYVGGTLFIGHNLFFSK